MTNKNGRGVPDAGASDPSENSPQTKKAKTQNGSAATGSENPPDSVQVAFLMVRGLLEGEVGPVVPPTLIEKGPTKLDLYKLRNVFDATGFRTSVVQSPRLALSVYKDSCTLPSEGGNVTEQNPFKDGKAFMLAMIGMHPDHTELERQYQQCFKTVYCLMLLCRRIRLLCSKACEDKDVTTLLDSLESDGRVLGQSGTIQSTHAFASKVPEKVAALIDACVKADGTIRPEQLEREYDRFTFHNSTFTNAALQLFVNAHSCCIKDIYFKRSHAVQYERITVYLYDPDVDLLKPSPFTFLPSVRATLDDGPEAVANTMLESFWEHLLRHGYFATQAIRDELSPDLHKYFLTGLAHDLSIPILL